MNNFNKATFLITGGTGSFGHAVLRHFLHTDIDQIRIFSRDEKKQDEMRHELQVHHPSTAQAAVLIRLKRMLRQNTCLK